MRDASVRPTAGRRTERRNGLPAAMIGVAMRRPVDTLAGLVAAAGVATILVNALGFQQGRHPAPLFGAAPPQAVAPSAPKQWTVEAPAPKPNPLVMRIQSELATRGYYDGPQDGLTGARTAAAITAFEHAERLPQTGEASERVLAAVMMAKPRKADAPKPAAARQSTTPPPASVPATTGSLASGKLMAMQRALSKMGYGPVTIDGKMGAATRAAIQSFERDHRLPATGEPSPAMLKALQQMSGAPLE